MVPWDGQPMSLSMLFTGLFTIVTVSRSGVPWAKNFFSKDNAANREKRKILDQNPEVEFAQSQPPKRATQKPSDLAVLRFDPPQGSTDLLIFSIPWKTTEEELKQHFSKFGNIVFANIKKDPETGNSRGFGFIRFENYESQKKAMEEATHEIDGRAVVLRLTKKVIIHFLSNSDSKPDPTLGTT